MSTPQLMGIVDGRGLRLVTHEGRLFVVNAGARDTVTPALLRVLRIHRERIIELLSRN